MPRYRVSTYPDHHKILRDDCLWYVTDYIDDAETCAALLNLGLEQKIVFDLLLTPVPKEAA